MLLKNRGLECEDGALYSHQAGLRCPSSANGAIEAGRLKSTHTTRVLLRAWFGCVGGELGSSHAGAGRACLDACGDTYGVVTETFSAATVAGHVAGARSILARMRPFAPRRQY